MNRNQQLTRFLDEIKYREKLTQTQVAEKIGTSLQYISDVKNGRYPLTDELLDKLYVTCPYLTEIENENKEKQKIGRPYYNVDFLGGFDVMVNDQTSLPAYFIDFTPYNKEGVVWCNITGHSMEPTISHGDIIAIKPIEDWRYVNYGEIYAIVTCNDMRTVKIIRKGSDDGHFRLVPVNTVGYDEQEIAKTDITHLFKVMGSIKRF